MAEHDPEAFQQLFESEPDQPPPSEVTHWVEMYSELTGLLQRQLDETLRFAEGRPQAMQEYLARENVKILTEELEAFKGRLALWRQRAGAPRPSDPESSY